MLKRQRTGSVICASCGVLVGVNDDTCYNCGRRNPGLWGFAPALRSLGRDLGFVPFVIGTCAVMYALTLVASRGNIGMGGLFNLLSPSGAALLIFGASGSAPVFLAGRWWTVLSAAWLHASFLHIFMNMLVVRQMAPAVADIYGPARMVIIYTAGSIVGFAASSIAGAFLPAIPILPPFVYLSGSRFTVGASASIAGLLGAVFHYGRRGGSSMARSYAMSYVMMLLMIGLMPGTDNYAHAGGFAGGYLASVVLDPLKPERINHTVIALICLGMSMLAILWSVITGLALL